MPRAQLIATELALSSQPEPIHTPATPSVSSPGASARAANPTKPARSGSAGILARIGGERAFAIGILGLAVAFNLIVLRSEITIAAPPLNDVVMHLQVLGRTIVALAAGQNMADPWMGSVPSMGYPLFHYYQHLPYYPIALLSLALATLSGGAIPYTSVFLWSEWLLLSLFPLSIYASMRRFGFARLEGAFAALTASLISTNFLYGLEYGSYIWRGNGMYTQLWGMVLLPLALAYSYGTLREGRGYLASVLLVSATLLSHVVSGYVALGSIVLMAVIVAWGERSGAPTDGNSSLRGVWRSAATLVALLLLVALTISYFLLPFVRDGAWMNRSIWELPEKYDSYGAPVVLNALVRGELLDYGRLPVLTLLAVVGVGVCLWRWRELRYRIPVVFALVWLLLYFGRPTWGVLLDLLPLSENLHLHRLILGFHLGTIYLAGIGLALPWQWALAREDRRALIAPAALTVLLLIPLYRDRVEFLALNAEWMERSAEAFAAEEADLTALFETIEAGPPGRAYAGLAATWGKGYRVGDAPLYALLTRAGFDVVGQLYQGLSLNSDLQVRFQDGVAAQYNLFNIRYVLTRTDWTVPDFYTPLGDFGRHRLYAVPTTGYFDLVDSSRAFAGDKSELYPAANAWLTSGLVEAKDHPAVYVGALPDGVQAAPLAAAPQVMTQAPPATFAERGRVITETVEANAYTARIDAAREIWLLLKATYHPGWRATVDGVAAPTVMLMPSYVGVKVGPGQHDVRLEYRQEPLRIWLLALGLATLAAIGAGERLWRRRARTGIAFASKPAPTPPAPSTPPVPLAPSAPSASLSSARTLRAHLPWLGGVLLAALLAGLPLFQMQMMRGHDTVQYVTRAVEFYRSLEVGNFFPRWAPDLNFGYGEPFFHFNPPLVYYLMAAFHALGASWVATLNVAGLALLVAAGAGMYLLGNVRFGPRGGLVAAVAYLFAPYLLSALYVRQALADFSAFASLPFAFWGVYEYARRGRPLHLVAGSTAVALLMLSSNPVALMAVPALIAWAAWLAWQARAGRLLARALAPIVAGLGLSAWFWLPAFVDRATVQTANLIEGYLNYGNHFVYLHQFLASPWGFGLSLPGPDDGMSFALGPTYLLAAVGAAVLLWWGRKRALRGRSWLAFFLFLLMASLFFASTLSRPVWDRVPLLQYMEFAWRFLTLAAFSSALLCGAVVVILAERSARYDRRLPGVIVALALAALLIGGLPKAQPEGWLDYDKAYEDPLAIAAQGLRVTTADEYAPIWVKERPQAPATAPLTFVSGQGELLAASSSVDAQDYTVAVEEDARLRANTFYFPGWTLYVDNVRQPLAYDNPQGVMEFSLPAGLHEVRLVLERTPERTWGMWLSLIALAALVVAAVVVRPWPGDLPDDADGWAGDEGAPFEGADAVEARRTSARSGTTAIVRSAAGLYLVCFAVYSLSGMGHFSSTDQIAVYRTTESLVERGDLAIGAINDAVQGPDGRYYGVFGIGQSLASIPLYLLGRAVEGAGSPALDAYWSGVDLGIWGGSVPIYFVSLFNSFVTPLICVLVFLFCLRMGFSQRRSLAVALVYAFGTAAWVYAREYFQHPLETLMLLAAVSVLFARRERLRTRDVLLAGAALGLGILTRVNLVVMAPVLALYLVYLLRGERKAIVAGLAAFGAPIVLALVANMGVNLARFGDLLAFRPQANAAMFTTPIWTTLYGFLLSPGRSLFLYSPPVILAPFAYVRFWRARRVETLLFAAIVAITLFTYSTFAHWHGDWAWGPRFLLPVLPFLVIPLGYLLESRRWSIALAALAVLGAGVQILGVAVNYGFIYWEWSRMNLSPAEAFLWDPAISAIPMHLRSLLAGRNLDLWLVWVAQTYGAEVLLLTLAVPLLLLAGGVALLWRADADTAAAP